MAAPTGSAAAGDYDDFDKDGGDDEGGLTIEELEGALEMGHKVHTNIVDAAASTRGSRFGSTFGPAGQRAPAASPAALPWLRRTLWLADGHDCLLLAPEHGDFRIDAALTLADVVSARPATVAEVEAAKGPPRFARYAFWVETDQRQLLSHGATASTQLLFICEDSLAQSDFISYLMASLARRVVEEGRSDMVKQQPFSPVARASDAAPVQGASSRQQPTVAGSSGAEALESLRAKMVESSGSVPNSDFPRPSRPARPSDVLGPALERAGEAAATKTGAGGARRVVPGSRSRSSLGPSRPAFPSVPLCVPVFNLAPFVDSVVDATLLNKEEGLVGIAACDMDGLALRCAGECDAAAAGRALSTWRQANRLGSAFCARLPGSSRPASELPLSNSSLGHAPRAMAMMGPPSRSSMAGLEPLPYCRMVVETDRRLVSVGLVGVGLALCTVNNSSASLVAPPQPSSAVLLPHSSSLGPGGHGTPRSVGRNEAF